MNEIKKNLYHIAEYYIFSNYSTLDIFVLVESNGFEKPPKYHIKIVVKLKLFKHHDTILKTLLK